MECAYCGSWRSDTMELCPQCGAPAGVAAAQPAGATFRAWVAAHKAQGPMPAPQPSGFDPSFDSDMDAQEGMTQPKVDRVARGNSGLLARYSGTGKLEAVGAQPADTLSRTAASRTGNPPQSAPLPDASSPLPSALDRPEAAIASSSLADGENDQAPVADDRALLPLGQGGIPGFGPGTEFHFPATQLSSDPAATTVYIPATLPRRRYALSNWHIISGLVSVLVVLVTACSLTGYWAAGRFNLLAASQSLRPLHQAAVTARASVQVIHGPAAKIIQTATSAESFSAAKYEPLNVTASFATGQYVYIVYKVRTKTAGIVRCQWYQNGVSLDVQDHPVLGSVNGYFAMSFPSAGTGKAELYWNGTLGQTILFTILDK